MALKQGRDDINVIIKNRDEIWKTGSALLNSWWVGSAPFQIMIWPVRMGQITTSKGYRGMSEEGGMSSQSGRGVSGT